MEKRYSRQMALPGWGTPGQQRLQESRVLVVGAGGLGSAVVAQLAAAGIGLMTVLDQDAVSESNLHRQFLYSESDVGRNKSVVAAEKAVRINSRVRVIALPEMLGVHDAQRLFSSHDVVMDCTDDPSTRLLLSDTSSVSGVPLVYASLYRGEGQITVFGSDGNGKHWNLRSLFPDYLGSVPPDCSSAGIAGPVASAVAGIQAMEALKLITGAGAPMIGVVCILDLLSNRALHMEYAPITLRESGTPDTWSSFYEIHTAGAAHAHTELELDELDDSGYLLVDVREEHELDGRALGIHVPMDHVRKSLTALPADRPLLFLCDRGVRSAVVAGMVRREFGRVDAFSLRGGLQRISSQVIS